MGYRMLALGSGALLLAGCSVRRAELAGHAGHHGARRGSYTITVELPDVATLPQNSPVMVDDVTVGSVSGIDAVQRPDGTFYAAVKLSLDGNVQAARELHRDGRADVAAGLPARRTGAAGDQPGRRQAARGLQHPGVAHRPLSHHRGGAVLAGRRGEQGQSRCAAGHHRGGVCGGRGPGGQLRRPDPAAGRADRLAGTADRRHHRRGRRARTGSPASWRSSKDSLGRALDTLPGGAEGAQQQPGEHRRRVHRAAQVRRPSRRTSWPRPRSTSPPTSRISIR